MIDTHAHLDFENFTEDQGEVIKRFFKDNGRAIVDIGADRKGILEGIKITKKYQNIFLSIGFHPDEINHLKNLFEVADFLEKIFKENKKIVAIGEIGLDYFHSKKETEHQQQKKLFETQLNLAKKINLPVVLHCRDAYEDMLEILSKKEYKEISKVLHCYSGEPKYTKKFLEFQNLIFSFTGNITFIKKDSPLWKSLEMIPLEKIMAETDSPFLAPVPNRGKRNEPAFVRYVIEKIAEIKETNFKEIEKITDKNAIRFFGLTRII